MAKHLIGIIATLLAATPLAAQTPAPAPAATSSVEALSPRIAAFFDEWMASRHAPGLVYGIVKDGRLILVRGAGIQDIERRRPVTPDTRFRIASMSKAFTALAILRLRDEGKVALDAPAETYVPELKAWRYPTSDAPRIRVRDLLHHTAGLVEDNPWGDRQQPLSEADFSAMLAAGMPFAQTPALGMEYSNVGYALLGRIVGTASGSRYQDYIGRTLLGPLGMASTGYDVLTGPQDIRALGYRWQDDAWVREPDMADGTFGAMGGLQTTANDFAKWVAFLLSAWPARDGADAGPVKRATVREIVQGVNFARGVDRPAILGTPCRQANAYAMGWQSIDDCDLGRVLVHGGGYPGYGSTVMLLPDAGVGVFAFSNRTYAGPALPAMQTMLAMRAAGLAPDRVTPVSPGLATAYQVARDVWASGGVERAPLAVNMLLDQDAVRRRAAIAAVKAKVGACPGTEPIRPISAMEGLFTWTCATGRVSGRVQRAPTPTVTIQALSFSAAP
jgi:CubicO group peptidase (beta-lactamase class C family)